MPVPVPRIVALSLLLLSFAGPRAAFAHSAPSSMLLASTADGGGELALQFDFTTVGRPSYSASFGPVDAYTGVLPDFQAFAADDALAGLYQLDAGTAVTITVTDLQPGRTAVKIGAVVLDEIGESTTLGQAPLPHTHPEWQMFVTGGEVGEGSVSFRLSASGPTSYADSPVYTVKLANGPLPPFVLDPIDYDSAAVACQSAVAKADAKLVSKTITALQKCLVAITALQAKEALLTPPADLASARAATEATCAGSPGASVSSTPLGRIDALQVSATAALTSRCEGYLDDRAVADHVATASCRAQQALAVMFPAVKPKLAVFLTQPSQGGDAMSLHLPCLHATVGG